MRVCVFGAGAIGGHLAARLATGGAEVSIIARGAHLAAVQRNGLLVRAPDREMHVRVAATDDPRTLGPQDAVLVTAKAPALPSVAAGIGPLLGPDTPVVFAMNGIPWWYFHAHGGALDGRTLPKLDPGDAVRRAIGTARSIGGVVYSACAVVEPGVVAVEHNRNRLVLGEPDGTLSARAEAIAAPLRAGGIRVDATDRIRDWIWSKLLMNLSSGPVAVLTQSAPKDVYAEPACIAAARAIYAEAGAVAAALGCTPQIDVEAQLGLSQSMTHKPSILQDLELGRPMEIDTIFDAPLELACMVGVPTPTLDLLVALAKVRARAAGLYGG
ncbi:ketopantoate reductase family protein [Limobrevibacterium gyesilva]|uniref:2-dehydropantoate 2-reductase n=1 Tax=Limobrevibacterium gyesilva TaxID=2991712 RepID=A0AA41YR46_9PROT|nr:2-dehydropantoate 2-reductase [Limobrevibacterium gyesilva]MCW3477315.1 2-dehydropantoate 2-reductase [Limobrevibacterium gyesilva]